VAPTPGTRFGSFEISSLERRYSFGAGITISNYDVTADGQRFVMVKDEAP
jgi:hypothetical protein